MDDDERLLTDDEVATMLGLQRSSLRRLRPLGQGPVWIRVGSRSVRYRRADVLAYIEERRSSGLPHSLMHRCTRCGAPLPGSPS